MRWMWRTAVGLAAGTCMVGAGLSACGTTNPGATSASSTSATVVASTSSSELLQASSTAQPSSTRSSTAQPSSSPTPSPSSSAVVYSATSTPSAAPITTSGATAPSGSTQFGRPGAQVTLTGTVEAGVEASCLILKDEKTGRQVNLNGGNKVVRLGVRVTVVGRIRNDLMSYCQQGPIFVVSSATVR